MKKKSCTSSSGEKISEVDKILRIMKLTCLLFFCIVFTLFAENTHSQNTKVTINKENTTLQDVLDEIEQQTAYLFLYNKKNVDVNRSTSIHASNQPVSKVLDSVLKGTNVNYEMVGNHILLSDQKHKTNEIALQQQPRKTITGTIVDERREPIIGANIIERGTTNGVTSDIDGNFALSVSDNATLQISYIGYLSQNISIGNKDHISIVLKEDNQSLDEVIVVGYGTTSARKTVSAVSTLKTEKTSDLPYTTTGASLQGRIAGVIVQQEGGEPGGNAPKISIRGGGTPLYVIDGVIRDANDFNILTSSDIESISILKDASATAVYGAQAGNGIVLVTTKQGVAGKLTIDYTAGFDFSKPTTIADRAGALDYVLAANAAARYDGQGEYSLYSKDHVDAIRNNTSSVYGNNDWYKEATRNFAPMQRHVLTISGENKGIRHFTSLGLLDQKSIYKEDHNNRYQRYNVRSNVSTTFEEYGLDVGLNIDGTYEKKTPNPYGQSDIWRNLLGYNKAIDRIYNDDGTYSPMDVHPIVYLDERSGYINQYENTASIQGYVNWDLPWVEGLSAKLTANSRYYSYDQKNFKSRAPQYSNGEISGGDRPKELYMKRDWNRGNTVDFGVNYIKEINKHFIELQGVYSYYDMYQEWFDAKRTGFISNDFDQLSAGDASTKENNGGASNRTRIGYVGRLRYAYNNKYFLEGNFRYDGSDNFAKDKRWGFFPSGAVAWVVSEEEFMKPLLDTGIVNFVKIRSSYGQVGLEDGVDRLGYIPVYDYSAQATVIDGKYVGGFSEGKLVSPLDLSWFTKDIFDIGVDFSFLKNTLSVTLDYYYYKTKGYLVSPTNRYTTTLGKDLPQIKSNSVHRRAGYEAALRYKNSYQDFKYEIGLQFTGYNELWEQKDDESLTNLMDPRKRQTHRKNVYEDYAYYIDKGVYRDYLFYVNNGIYQDMADILDSPRRLSSSETKRGDLGYKDINGDGKIDSDDQIKLGKPFFPSFDYGIDFSLEYKGFFMNGLFQGTGDRYMELNLLYKGGNIVNSNYAFQLDSWSPDNLSAKFPRASAQQSPNSGNNTLVSDFWVINAKFFRLKSLQVGYDFKQILLKNTPRISKLKLSLMGTNLFTISDAMDYFDPESYNFGEAYPVQKTYSVVLNIGI